MKKVFLSYARKDVNLAVRLERDLQVEDIDVWRDQRAIRVGDDWEEVIRNAIRTSSGVLYLGTAAARASDVVREELKIAKMYKKRIYPLFAGEKEAWADVAPMGMGIMGRQYIDIRNGQYREGINQLVRAIEENAMIEQPPLPQLPPSPPGSLWRRAMRVLRSLRGRTRTRSVPRSNPQQQLHSNAGGPRNPYKGLRAFTREDAQDFFGRNEVIDRLIEETKHILAIERHGENRQEPRFITVVGPSGSGKSSVVMAGLLPRLQSGVGIPGSDHWVLLPVVYPGEKPLSALAQALSAKLSDNISQGEILEELQDRSTCALHSYAARIAGPRNRVILLVDQFEELFTQTANDREREQFIHQLITAATEPENKVIVIATLRVDFSDYPMHYPLLHSVIEAHRIAIPPMTLENLRAVIEGPANLPGVGLRFEENLVGDLLFDIDGQEENLPLLQFTLAKLFDKREGNCLTRQAYEEIGGVRGALNQHAEETYNDLPSHEHRQIAEALFTRLINPGGLGQDATRRRVPSSELTFDDDERDSLMRTTIDAFINARLITANRVATSRRLGGSEGIPIYEISHEALISAWARLASWTNTARDDILMRQTLDNEIERWEGQGRPGGLLYTNNHLKEAEKWAKRTIPTEREKRFLRASKHRERRGRSMRLGMGLLSFLLLVGGLRGYFYYLSLATTVTTLQDNGPGSLRQVIRDALPGSTITFDPSLRGKIVLSSGDLTIDKDITVNGPSTQQISITNNKNKKRNDRVHISAGASVKLTNLAFRDSHVSGTAFIENAGSLTLDHCLVTGNSSDYNGGGIANLHGTLVITNSEVSDNEAQRNGGGIYSWDGAVTLNNSKVHNNSAGNDGGGIYELSGRLTLNATRLYATVVSDNKTTSSASTSNGGGISVLDGELILDSSIISGNSTNGYGGGLTLLGTLGLIDKSIIAKNKAGHLGGGLAVEKNSESGIDSQAMITGMEVEPAQAPKTSYYIWDNTAPQDSQHPDVLGPLLPLSSTNLVTVHDDTSEPTGSPPPSSLPENDRAHFLGTIDFDQYCHTQHPNVTASFDLTNAEEISCVYPNGTGIVQHMPIVPTTACQSQYKQTDVIARLADYYDPSSWQCYLHEKLLDKKLFGFITRDLLYGYCKHKGYIDVNAPPSNGTAYDWSCRDRNNSSIGIAIADACGWHYKRNDAFDVLTEFNRTDGWDCYAPE